MKKPRTPAIAITCADNRLHDPSIVPQLEQLLASDSVYLMTMPGPEGCILGRKDDPHNYHLLSLISDLTLLTKAKNINSIALVGHCDCAGHPVSDRQHELDVCKATQILQNALPETVTVIPLLAYPPTDDKAWSVKLLNPIHSDFVCCNTPN